MKKVAIVGAGISGLFFANLLRHDDNYEVAIYEKNNSINLEKGYGIQLSINSIHLLNKIGFQKLSPLSQFNPEKIDFYSSLKKKKICDLDISSFNTNEAKYTTLQRSTLIEFLKEKLPNNLLEYNKTVSKINYVNDNIELIFKNHSSIECDYLIVADGVFSHTKSLIANKNIKPKYFNSIAIRGTINKDNLNKIDHNNISLFLGSKFHLVIYPISKDKKCNFICIMKKNLNSEQFQDQSLFNDKKFVSSIIYDLSSKIDTNILENLKDIECFPIFISDQIYKADRSNIFLIGDAFFALPPTFAQGASQSIEAAFDLYEMLKNNRQKFTEKRIERIQMINRRSKFNYFAFHLSNPFMIFIRDLSMKYLVKNHKFINNYLGKIYK